MIPRRKNYPEKKGILKDSVIFEGKFYHEGKCIGKLNNIKLEEFEQQVKILKQKFS